MPCYSNGYHAAISLRKNIGNKRWVCEVTRSAPEIARMFSSVVAAHDTYTAYN